MDSLGYYISQASPTIIVLACFAVAWKYLKPRNEHSLRSVAILVLGDIGRSPRMMYHAESFSNIDFETHIIGYGGSKPIPSLGGQRIQLHYLPEPPKILRLFPFVFSAPFKIAHQIYSILFELMIRIDKPPEFILVQNPPSIPTLALAWLVGSIRGSKVIIDWHNLGYSILALKLGQNHPFVRIAMWFEATFGRSAYAHLFVTQAMHDRLAKDWSLRGRMVVLHDRPPRHFHRASHQESHELFLRLQSSLTNKKILDDFLPRASAPYSTPFTHIPSSTDPPTQTAQSSHGSSAHRATVTSPPSLSLTTPTYAELRLSTLRPDRPALLVSSTSWTPDEDFGILLEALSLYELRANEVDNGDAKLPKLLVIVTGKGPLRDKYMSKVSDMQKQWKWVRCISLWLEAQDYPLLLGSADLGVCLHSSSSALDLPMKVVDMFGCGLPVCALHFKCLDELVKDKLNGLIFKDASQLAEQLETLLISYPDAPRLAALRASLMGSSKKPMNIPHSHLPHQHGKPTEGWEWGSWEDNWGRTIRPLVLSDVG
ncbi:mannosyltransferase [Infundibulicybe gibba]|nr:mannosyltransferase [Infundibulicybe gibba]